MNLSKIADCLNTIGNYLAMRDLASLTDTELKNKYNIEKADLLILFGGVIPFGCDVAAQAYLNGVAHKIMVVGGQGHTTQSLRGKFASRYSQIPTDGRSEADIISDYLKIKYNMNDIIIENKSTNCGNNVSNTLSVLKDMDAVPETAVIIQDSTMQRRMDAGFRKIWSSEKTRIINFAPYRAEIMVRNDKLCFKDESMWGMWPLEHYITLLMGEIPRLSDDENGYGPNGKDFIAHVDIPTDVLDAFGYLKTFYSSLIRNSDEKYSSK